MSVDELMEKYDGKLIQEAARRVGVKAELRGKLAGSRWSEAPIIFDSTTLLLPAFGDQRPLAVTLYGYGLSIEPVYVLHHSGKPDSNFVLHVEEKSDGLRLYVEDAFDITLGGSYETGFVLRVRREENTAIEEERP